MLFIGREVRVGKTLPQVLRTALGQPGPYRKKLDQSHTRNYPTNYKNLGFRPAEMLQK